MTVVRPRRCECKIVGNEIDFCRLHENAECLQNQLEYLQQFLFNHRMAETGIENTKREIVLPHLSNILRLVQEIKKF